MLLTAHNKNHITHKSLSKDKILYIFIKIKEYLQICLLNRYKL